MENEFHKYISEIVNENIRFYHQKAWGAVSKRLNKTGFHTHDFPELVYVVRAKGKHITENTEYTMKKGLLFLNAPGVHHKIEIDPDEIYDRYYICFNPEILGDFDIEKVYEKISVRDCSENMMIENIFKRADYYCSIFSEEDFGKMLCLLIKELFYNLLIYDDSGDVQQSSIHPLLVSAIDYIGKNLFEIRLVSQVSEHLFISERYLYDLFKSQLRTTPKKYINEKKLHCARQEIMQGAKPNEVYFKIGFSDYSTFYRSYLKQFGTAPSRERTKINLDI